ncbi:hypothetical protein D9613_001240 [Agrocybe pediades]|uniref:Uncharacterized protein n=1 Tax=Agrocybe pediades TaxID=84607 RepID=A0A8H4R488_9AGAR|nr:hypothetical protein D9613_001240 [Agrocybe pediades]
MPVKEHSDQIDRELEEDHKKFKRECKILLLGSGESARSTIVKQMKIIHQDGFKPEELDEYRPVVYKNVLDSAQQVIVFMKKIGLECDVYSNRALAEKVLDYRLDTSNPGTTYFSPEIAEAIHQLWKDPVIPKIMDEHSSDFYLMDSAAYLGVMPFLIRTRGPALYVRVYWKAYEEVVKVGCWQRVCSLDHDRDVRAGWMTTS